MTKNISDIARLALAMHDHSHFFSIRRGLSFSFNRDLNGGGMQSLEIKKADKTNPQYLIQIYFDVPYANNRELLYEADLIMDRRKDYEPSVNKGKHWFAAESANMFIDWNGDEIRQWRSDVDRLSRTPETLSGWIESDLEMIVSCSSKFPCRRPAILDRNDLKQHVVVGLSLQDLKARFRCSKCGKREARVKAFF